MPKAPKWINDAVETLLSGKMPLMRVTGTDYINPHIKRIRLQGDVKGAHFHPGYAIAIRVNDMEYRNYTPAFSDPETGIIEMIIHLHGMAPGSSYIDNLRVNDQVRLIPPRGRKMYNDAVKHQFLLGDETSLGFACALQKAVKRNKQQVHFYFELDHENSTVPTLLGLENYTIVPKNKIFSHLDLVHTLPLFQTTGWQEGNFIITGNARSVQTIRKALKQHSMSGNIMAQAYWAAGKTGL